MCFVTGATGWVDSVDPIDLIAAGHQVLGLTRSEQGAQALAAAGITVQSTATVPSPHLAPSPTIQQPRTTDEPAPATVKPQHPLRILSNPDPDALADLVGFVLILSQPQQTLAA